ncbi:hypothetical protein BDW75DRAFT_235356 [Aspergillus navahoensis]
MAIKQIVCSGTPYEIGQIHGYHASTEISRAITLYAKMFARHSKLSWPEVQDLAKDFDQLIRDRWPRVILALYHDSGIADGSEQELINIVRTEIVFGKFSDGCTSLYYRDRHSETKDAQAKNLIQLTLVQKDLPVIKMITEAGLIGKIGLNSAGVGVCFNAIRAKGLNKSYILVHLGLRITLESRLALQAVKSLKSIGIASSAHMLISNANNAVRLEFMALIFSHIPVDMMGFIAHLNHMLLPHAGINEPAWLADSLVRVATVGENIKSLGGKLDQERFSELFRDKTGFPCLINRATSEGSDIATLAVVVMGRPSDEEAERVVLELDR